MKLRFIALMYSALAIQGAMAFGDTTALGVHLWGLCENYRFGIQNTIPGPGGTLNHLECRWNAIGADLDGTATNAPAVAQRFPSLTISGGVTKTYFAIVLQAIVYNPATYATLSSEVSSRVFERTPGVHELRMVKHFPNRVFEKFLSAKIGTLSEPRLIFLARTQRENLGITSTTATYFRDSLDPLYLVVLNANNSTTYERRINTSNASEITRVAAHPDSNKIFVARLIGSSTTVSPNNYRLNYSALVDTYVSNSNNLNRESSVPLSDVDHAVICSTFGSTCPPFSGEVGIAAGPHGAAVMMRAHYNPSNPNTVLGYERAEAYYVRNSAVFTRFTPYVSNIRYHRLLGIKSDNSPVSPIELALTANSSANVRFVALNANATLLMGDRWVHGFGGSVASTGSNSANRMIFNDEGHWARSLIDFSSTILPNTISEVYALRTSGQVSDALAPLNSLHQSISSGKDKTTGGQSITLTLVPLHLATESVLNILDITRVGFLFAALYPNPSQPAPIVVVINE